MHSFLNTYITGVLSVTIACCSLSCTSGTGVMPSAVLPYEGLEKVVLAVNGRPVTFHWVEPSCFTFNASFTGRPYEGADKTEQVFQDGFWISDAVMDEKVSHKAVVHELQGWSRSCGYVVSLPSEAQWEAARNAGIITNVKMPELTIDDWSDMSPVPLELDYCNISKNDSQKVLRTGTSRFPKKEYVKGPFAYRMVIESNRTVEDLGLPAYFDINNQPIETRRDISSETFSVPAPENNPEERVSFRMLPVKGGDALLGVTTEQEPYADEDEMRARNVHVEDFEIAETEVSVRLWKAVMGTVPSGNTLYNLDRPVVGVSWYDAKEFIVRLNALTGRVFRLPTEHEWEWAARGGVKSHGYVLAGGNPPADVGIYVKKESKAPTLGDVASRLPNELGLYDMSGNAWEWVQGVYEQTSQPKGVLRGGSHRSKSGACRVSNRMGMELGTRLETFGFRIAL